MMFVWVFYDISANSLRLRVADTCLDTGLTRFQKSIFFGELSTARMKHLGDQVREIFSAYPAEERSEADSVLMFSLCDTCLKQKAVIGKPFDEDAYRKRAFVIL